MSIAKLWSRVWGRPYPMPVDRTRFPKQGAHVESRWTTPEHFAHNNYERTHLPQLCVVASGWKARLLALVLLPMAPHVFTSAGKSKVEMTKFDSLVFLTLPVSYLLLLVFPAQWSVTLVGGHTGVVGAIGLWAFAKMRRS